MPDAHNMVVRIDALFLIDRHAREQQLGGEQRHAFRCAHALEWVEEIRNDCLSLARSVLPKSMLGQAVA